MTLNNSDHYDRLEHEYVILRDYFGHDNLRMDLQQEIIGESDDDDRFVDAGKVRYVNVRITHIPSGKVAHGTKFSSQLENSIEALKKLREEVGKR